MSIIKTDGWIEERLFLPDTEWVASTYKTINFKVPFSNNPYVFDIAFADSTNGPTYAMFGTIITATQFTFRFTGTKTSNLIKAEGY